MSNFLKFILRSIAFFRNLEGRINDLENQKKAAQEHREELEKRFVELRERLARLEALREGDAALIKAELACFETQVERLTFYSKCEGIPPQKSLKKIGMAKE